MVVLMGVMSRSSAHADSPGVQLPAQQTYPVQQEAPLFTNNAPQVQASNDDQQAPVNAPQTQTQPQAPAAAQPLGIQDPGGPGFDVYDIGIKLAAVLGLAYGSLMLLKRAGIGGASAGRSGGTNQGMRVVSSLALAPNRTVHVIKVAGGRTLLIGATPSAVNLLADLGDLADEDTPEAASFFDVLKGKLN
jgi:flagellar biogenesis protein FliO